MRASDLCGREWESPQHDVTVGKASLTFALQQESPDERALLSCPEQIQTDEGEENGR